MKIEFITAGSHVILAAGEGGEGEWGSSVSWFRPVTSLVQLIQGRDLKESNYEPDICKCIWNSGSTVSYVQEG